MRYRNLCLIGWTGGIGMGKSASGEILRRKGVAVADSDELARDLVEPGQAAYGEIVDAFGREVVGAGGKLNRQKIAAVVFTDAGARRTIEAILHPRIRKSWLELASAWDESGRRVGVVLIPLLFETGAAEHFDRTVCVACKSETQQARLLARGWTVDQIEGRLAAQWPVEQKMALADAVVWTEGSLPSHEQQIELILTRFFA